MRAWTFSLLAIFFCANAMAFGRAKVQPPAELSAFTPIDQQGKTALAEIESHPWEHRLVVTVDWGARQIQLVVRQTAQISFVGNVLQIQSSAGESGLDGSMFSGQTDDYSSQNFNAPVVYSGESVASDGTVQVAIGVDYQDGNAVDKNENKIELSMYPDSVFSGPDHFTMNSVPNFDQEYVRQLFQFVVFSWNKNNPAALEMRGISDSSSTSDLFVAKYAAESESAPANPNSFSLSN